MSEILEKLDQIILLLTKENQSPFTYWTIEEEIYVKEMTEKGLSCFDIAIGIKEKFNKSRSTSAVASRRSLIGVDPPVPKQEERIQKSFFKKKNDERSIMDCLYDDDAPF